MYEIALTRSKEQVEYTLPDGSTVLAHRYVGEEASLLLMTDSTDLPEELKISDNPIGGKAPTKTKCPIQPATAAGEVVKTAYCQNGVTVLVVSCAHAPLHKGPEEEATCRSAMPMTMRVRDDDE